MRLAIVAPPERPRRSIAPYLWGGLAVVALVVIAIARGGLLGLPSAPSGVSAAAAGLADLRGLAARAIAIETAASRPGAPSSDPVLRLAGPGLAALRAGDAERGLDAMYQALALAPHDLVLGNAFRMEVFRLRRAAIFDVAHRRTLAAELPPALVHEPIATLERVGREHPSRELTLQLALAWVDEMLLFPALEIKAPASVESVRLLSDLLAREPAYVPALYARGLNYLHRPARLKWPEARAAAHDAASKDIGTGVAIGRKVGGASPELVATLALALGDAYAKEGAHDRGRSWWQVARNSSRDPEIAEAVQRRLTWGDHELLDRLEADLENQMLDLDRPLTDLAIMWNGAS